MRCERFQLEKQAYLDGELAVAHDARTVEKLALSFAEHLEECPDCRESVSRAQRLDRLLNDNPPPPPPEGFDERVIALARSRKPLVSPARRGGWFPAAGWEWWSSSSGLMRLAIAASLLIGVGLGTGLSWDSAKSGAVNANAVNHSSRAARYEYASAYVPENLAVTDERAMVFPELTLALGTGR